MTDITHTPVTLGDHETLENVYSATIFANELSRDGLSVDIDGMDFSNYQKNPVVLFAHDFSGRTESGGLPIGRTLRLERTPDGRIRAEFEFLSGDPFADRVRNAWNRGFLRGASIGWRAIEARPNERGRGVRIVRSELIEWSIVAVPADPDALRGAHSRVMRALIDENGQSEGEGDTGETVFRHTDRSRRMPTTIEEIQDMNRTIGEIGEFVRERTDTLTGEFTALREENDRLRAGRGGVAGAASREPAGADRARGRLGARHKGHGRPVRRVRPAGHRADALARALPPRRPRRAARALVGGAAGGGDAVDGRRPDAGRG